MSEHGNRVQKLFQSLARHSGLIAEAFDGVVHGGDRQRDAAIAALFDLGVLKPYDEGSYRLNPRLRQFIADHFSSYHAFQALHGVSGTVQQALAQWRELSTLKSVRASRDAERLFAAFDDSIADIAYAIDQNLALLHTLLATQYGNVDNLHTKLRQNRYYAQQVERFLRDVEGIDAFVARVEDESIARGLPQVRRIVERRLAAHYLRWTAQIKDAQASISKRLFQAQVMAERLERLARTALWLTRHRTEGGWELTLDASADLALVRPEKIELKPQPDITDSDDAMQQGFAAAIARLPPAPIATGTAPMDAPQMLIAEDDFVAPPPDPIRQALSELVASSRGAGKPISCLGWKKSRPALAAFDDEAWLLFCCMQLKGSGLRLAFAERRTLDPFPLNETFYDLEVRQST